MHGLIRQGMPRLAGGRAALPGVCATESAPPSSCWGLTSTFTDVGAEMVNAVLPIYLLYSL